MPKNQIAPDNSSSSVYSVSGRQVSTPAPGASGRTANFSATNSDTGSKLSTNGGGLRKFTGTNGDVRIPLHPSEPRGDDARGSGENGQ